MKTFYKKTPTILTMICLGLIFISSCKKDDPEDIIYGNAKVRVVNTVPNSAAQDFYQGDTKISTTGISYGSSSDYLTIKAGNSTVSFRNLGTTTVSAIGGIGANTDGVYTLFYYTNGNGGGELGGFADDNAAPASGKAKVRFINLGLAFNNTLNISYNGLTGAIISGLGYGNLSAYASIDANIDLSVVVLGSASTTVIPGNNFVAGKNYTVWFDAASSTSANYHVILQN